MVANMEKIKKSCRALLTFLGNLLTLKFPLWLFIVVYLVAVLFISLVACNVSKASGARVDSAVVGYTEYHGHNYVVFSAAGSFSVVHDPDCVCKLVD